MRGAPWARLRSASPRRRINHAGGVILAQDGSWRFFDRGGDGGDAGRVLRDADRNVIGSNGSYGTRTATGPGDAPKESLRFARFSRTGSVRTMVF